MAFSGKGMLRTSNYMSKHYQCPNFGLAGGCKWMTTTLLFNAYRSRSSPRMRFLWWTLARCPVVAVCWPWRLIWPRSCLPAQYAPRLERRLLSVAGWRNTGGRLCNPGFSSLNQIHENIHMSMWLSNFSQKWTPGVGFVTNKHNTFSAMMSVVGVFPVGHFETSVTRV